MPPELPLLIATEHDSDVLKEVYDDILRDALALRTPDNWAYASMGEYCVANDEEQLRVIHVSSALTCTVMLVHMRRGVGALGHYYATGDVAREAGGVMQMVEACNNATGESGAQPVCIALSAACVEDLPSKLCSAVKSLYPSSAVRYLDPPNPKDIYGACMYMPLRYRAAFFDETVPWSNWTKRLQGMKVFAYDDTRRAPIT